MPRYVTIGYGDRDGDDRTPAGVRNQHTTMSPRPASILRSQFSGRDGRCNGSVDVDAVELVTLGQEAGDHAPPARQGKCRIRSTTSAGAGGPNRRPTACRYAGMSPAWVVGVGAVRRLRPVIEASTTAGCSTSSMPPIAIHDTHRRPPAMLPQRPKRARRADCAAAGSPERPIPIAGRSKTWREMFAAASSKAASHRRRTSTC
jgi:hypothetical protein